MRFHRAAGRCVVGSHTLAQVPGQRARHRTLTGRERKAGHERLFKLLVTSDVATLPRVRISIVTPSFRNSDWLKLCVASVADQAGVEVEHIVQDALSDDGTQEWLARDRRVQAY